MATHNQAPAPSAPPPGESLPHPRLRRHPSFPSRFLPGARDITVYLPPGYDENPARAYPLLVLQDGQNLFDPERAFVRGQTWRVAETADAVIAAGQVEPLLIAGIDHGGERRLAEYTPTRDWRLGGGDAKLYSAMLLQEILPWLRSRYRLRPEPQHTGLGGSSLGALVSLWLGLGHPDLFGRLAVLSPSVWWNHRWLLQYVGDTAPRLAQRPRIWLDVGEGEGRRTVADAERLAARLRDQGWRADTDLHFEKVPGATHNEASWAERVAPMLRFLFPAAPAEAHSHRDEAPVPTELPENDYT